MANLESSDILIVGGGLPSLLIAKFLAHKFTSVGLNSKIHIIEKSNAVGGQYKSLTYSNSILFDLGMHIYYETEIPEMDSCFRTILKDDEWIFLEGNKKDVAGIYFDGKLQADTPYPDFRHKPLNVRKHLLSELVSQIFNENQVDASGNAGNALERHFGKYIAEEVFKPILKNIYGIDANNLSELAIKLTAINRISILDEEEIDKVAGSDFLRNRIAYPNQHSMTYKRANNSRGLYPKNFGFQTVIDRLEMELIALKVSIHKDASIFEVQISNKSIKEVTFHTSDGIQEKLQPDHIIWGADSFLLAKLLGREFSRPTISKSKKYINLMIQDGSKLGKLYYFYNFDKFSNIFRVTNYQAYCPQARSSFGIPICIEYWDTENLNNEQLISKVTKDLIEMNLLKSADQVTFSDVPNISLAFPDPTLEVEKSISEVINFLDNLHLDNLTLVGTLSSPNVFFLHEVLKDAYSKIRNLDFLISGD